MKKNLKFFLLFLLCPLALTACGTPNSYVITASSSDISLGSAKGGSAQKATEGSKITLNAIENNAAEHPFICWIKDRKSVVSMDKDFELTYSEETQGNYTALFHETEQVKMRYASISTIDLNQEFDNLKYKVMIMPLSRGNNDYDTLVEGDIQGSLDNKTVVYFEDENYQYRVRIELEYEGAQGLANVRYNFTTILSGKSFDQSGHAEITENVEGLNGDISITFNKVQPSLFASVA